MESDPSATGDARRWTLYGAAFGVCFPVLALSILVAQSGLRGALGQFAGDPLLWIIATAPLVLGAFAWLGGRQHETVRAMSANLERLVDRRTAALSRALAQVQLVTDSVGDGLVTVTLDGVVEHASAAAVRVFGAPDGRPASAYLLGDGGAVQMFDLGLEQLREGLAARGDPARSAPRAAARAVRGDLSMETREGVGTVLRVDVPLHPAESVLPRAA
jgi:hypothetical protein